MTPLSTYSSLLEPINGFLQSVAPYAWIDQASQPENLSLLLIGHMICELKAAQTAAWLVRKYAVDKTSGELLLTWLVPYEDLIYRKEGSLSALVNRHHDISKKLNLRKDCSYSNNLVDRMVLLIKEELHHFCQVLAIMK